MTHSPETSSQEVEIQSTPEEELAELQASVDQQANIDAHLQNLDEAIQEGQTPETTPANFRRRIS